MMAAEPRMTPPNTQPRITTGGHPRQPWAQAYPTDTTKTGHQRAIIRMWPHHSHQLLPELIPCDPLLFLSLDSLTIINYICIILILLMHGYYE